MAVDSREAAGNPYFDANSADDQAADLTELGRYALFRGGLMRGTTAEREAFSTAGYAGEGDHWDDTTLDVLYRWSGSTWVAVKARGGFTLAGSTWDSAGGIFGGGTQATLANSGATGFVTTNHPFRAGTVAFCSQRCVGCQRRPGCGRRYFVRTV